jgi:outer membrane protein insertion porin family/translocation and assembly module TamA
VRSPSTAALTRFAAICGFLVAPSAAAAQLRCSSEGDVQIRKVSFEGNATFSDAELALHVVSTPTDLTRRFLDKRWLIPAGTGVGATIGLLGGHDTWERGRRGAIFGGVGFVLGYAVSRISGTPRCLRPGTLAGDILNLSGFYRDQGFADVRVDTTTRVDGRWVDVGFRVVEGQPVLVDSLRIIGFDTATMGALPQSLKSVKGGRYSPTITQEDIDSLETRLRNTGYPEGRALREVNFPSKYRAAVQYTIEPGPRARIGTVTIEQQTLEGRSRAVDEAVVRRLLRFAPGDFYNQRALFESERRFYQTGTFVSAEVAPNVSHVGADSLVDVKVTVVEDLPFAGSVEPGIGTLDCLRLRAEYSDKAFLRGINRLDVSGSVSKVGFANRWPGVFDACRLLQGSPEEVDISSRSVNYNATVRATRPLPLPGGLLPSISLYTERRGGYNAYLRTTVLGGALSMSKLITRTVFFESSYNLEYGHTEAADPVLCFLFRACDQSSRDQLTGDKPLAVLGARLSRDRRNHPDSASAGTVLRLDTRTSQPWIASDKSLRFNKGVVDASWYHRMLGAGVLAVRARAGLVGGAEKSSSGVTLPPPQERLYAGGETSVRGFRQNELGPVIYLTSVDDTTAARVAAAPSDSALQELTMRLIPVGGNAMYVGNLEYRLPGPFLKTLQTILFVDVGAVSTSGGFSAIAGSDQFRWTPGVALRYFSPVGPVQINVGYNSYDPLAGPVYSDRIDRNALTCISGIDSSGACRPLSAIRPRNGFLRRLTFTVAFPPDF